ncbi:protein NDR1-like [Tripterygium wilfordii]|uniref:Protein NDR1-like n=1 Tax=Tripterygium wilfordii TaxID=458696 RepID=A0A7J7C4D4_TRIWF|nr:NDR1/HIN1-like protein 3 [Tripterygium wilfordii]KAF5729010.1 protein NDR1-like [Tripterygium wilfordii]
MFKQFFTKTMSFKMALLMPSKSLVSVCFWLLKVVVLLCMVFVVIWLSLRPKIPVFKVTNAYAPALDGLNSTFYRSKVSKNNSISLQFEISNPNKRIGIYYGDIYITLYSGHSVISSKPLPGFYQGYKISTVASVFADADQKTWRGVKEKHINLTVRLQTAVQYKILRSKSKHHFMDLEAYIPIGPDGRILEEDDVKLHRKV